MSTAREARRERRAAVPRLREIALAPEPSVVNLCRELLVRAERGELRGIVVAFGGDSKSCGSAFERGDASIADLVLGLEYAKKRLLEIE